MSTVLYAGLAVDKQPWILLKLNKPWIIESAQLLQRGGNANTLKTINRIKFELSDGTSFSVSFTWLI